MKKLINVAEELYKQIDKAQVHLINARLSNDEEGKKSAISEIETAMCNASQLLKCFIDRKDNIVDTGKIFHSTEETPDMRGGIYCMNLPLAVVAFLICCRFVMKNGVISKEFIKSSVGHTLMIYYRKEVKNGIPRNRRKIRV